MFASTCLTLQLQDNIDFNLQPLTYTSLRNHSQLSKLILSGSWHLGKQQVCYSEGRLCIEGQDVEGR